MRNAYSWRQEDVVKMLHTRKSEQEYQKDVWYRKYIEAETQEDEDCATRHMDEINGYLVALRLAIALLEARG